MKKGMLNALTLVLCLINLVLSIVIIFTFVPAIKRTSNLVDRVCEILDINVGTDTTTGANTGVSITDLSSVNIVFNSGNDTTTTVKLSSSDGKEHYLKLGLSVNLDTTHEDYLDSKNPMNEDTITSAMTVIDGIIIDVVSNYSYEQLSQTAYKAELENAILKRLQNSFGSGFIYSVSIGTYTIS